MPFRSQKLIFFLFCVMGIFFLNGIFLALSIPPFQGPDEQIHYGTIQYRSEPKEKTWPIQHLSPHSADARDIQTYNFSQELTSAAKIASFDEIKFESKNTAPFSKESFFGPGEENFLSTEHSRFITTTPSAHSGTVSWYYAIGVKIEHVLSGYDIFTRMFALRIFSVFLGVFVIFLGFYTARSIGFSNFESLSIATFLAFQPMLSASASQINIDIALIASFSLFLFAGTALLRTLYSPPSEEKHSNENRYISLAFLAALLGFYAKGPGIVLVASFFPLFAFLLYKRHSFDTKKYLLTLLLITFSIIGLLTLFAPEYTASITAAGKASKFDSLLESISRYIEKTIDFGEFRETALSYWGNFGWLDTRIGETVFEIIWIIEIVGFIGIFCLLFPWQKLLPFIGNEPARKILEYFIQKRDFLPKKNFLVFLLGVTIALELAIRFYDWRVFDATGKILIGTPGRYFLPNVIAHIILLVSGLGFFLRSQKQFHLLLKSLIIAILLLNISVFFDSIIPRYYL